MPPRKVSISSKTSPEFRTLCEERLDPLLADIHTMLQLPRSEVGLEAGCNLSCALVLCAIVAGLSDEYFRATIGPTLCDKPSYEEKFREVLARFFPWSDLDVPSHSTNEAIAELYRQIRHPLVHSLGQPKKHISRTAEPNVAKRSYTAEELKNVEQSNDPPSYICPVMKKVSGRWTLNLLGLYWGVRRMVFNVSVRI